MTDTQWPRYMVFQQLKPGEPHQHSGTVHAPDSELALLNARDVFVRRPDCYSLWVVRADRIFAKTAEELRLDPDWLKFLPESDTPAEAYCVCLKLAHKGNFIHVGDVEAADEYHALKMALSLFEARNALVWWVFPARLLRKSEADDAPVMFAPAHDKSPFRDQTEFPTIAMMKQIRAAMMNSEADAENED